LKALALSPLPPERGRGWVAEGVDKALDADLPARDSGKCRIAATIFWPRTCVPVLAPANPADRVLRIADEPVVSSEEVMPTQNVSLFVPPLTAMVLECTAQGA